MPRFLGAAGVLPARLPRFVEAPREGRRYCRGEGSLAPAPSQRAHPPVAVLRCGMVQHTGGRIAKAIPKAENAAGQASVGTAPYGVGQHELEPCRGGRVPGLRCAAYSRMATLPSPAVQRPACVATGRTGDLDICCHLHSRGHGEPRSGRAVRAVEPQGIILRRSGYGGLAEQPPRQGCPPLPGQPIIRNDPLADSFEKTGARSRQRDGILIRGASAEQTPRAPGADNAEPRGCAGAPGGRP